MYLNFVLTQMEDTLWAGLTDSYIKTPMGITAENLAEKFGTTRLEADEFAFASQERWAKGIILIMADDILFGWHIMIIQQFILCN